MQTTDGAADNGAPWQIRGPIPSARLSPLYRLATALVAVAMILLPLIYIGIIFAACWWLWDYAQAGPALSGRRGRAVSGSIFLYVTPLVIGAITILFMIKPLFHRRPKSADPRTLTREDEPRLFDFIDRICALVRAPRPRRVQVDLQVNASAALTHGVWSILSRRLTLTIGLPLAGGLTVRQLGGVLAHEFGHFAQGAGMGTTYIVRMISMWFARVVYERDQWDATLEAWAREGDWRIMIILQIARFIVWVVRRILWVLMAIGQLISSVLMRQMEFDADHYEIQTSGTTGFITTARQLRVLGLGAHVTHTKQQEAFNAKRLVDNFPGWMLHETATLPAELCAKVLAAAAEEKTGWFDTHPSDRERVARAEQAKSEGVLTGDEPASVLFSDFTALSRTATQDYYRDVLELPVQQIQLQPLETMTAESDASKRGHDAIEAFFHGLHSIRTLTFVRPTELQVDATDWRSFNAAARATPAEMPTEMAAAAKDLNAELKRLNEMHVVLGLSEAGVSLSAREAAELKLNKAGSTDIRTEAGRASARLEAIVVQAAPVLAQARHRLLTALNWLLSQPSTPQEVVREIRVCVATLARLEPLAGTLAQMQPLVNGMVIILQNLERASDQNIAFSAASSRARRLQPLIDEVLRALHEAPFPFEHAAGKVTFASYLVDGVRHPDSLILALLQGEAILDRIYPVYHKALGRLTLLALEAETAMDRLPAEPVIAGIPIVSANES
jgi:Zn-dependent protease with chaperone function